MTITAYGSSEPLAPPRDGVTLAIATGNRFQRDAPGPGLLGPKVQSGLRLNCGAPAEARPFVPLQWLAVTFLCPIHRCGHSKNPGLSTSIEPRPGELAEHIVSEGKVPKS